MANDPMQQFEIKKIFDLPTIAGHDLSFTNSALWMSLTALGVVVFFALTAKGKLIPGRMQSLGEMSHEFIANMLKDTCLLYTSPSPRDRTRSRMPSSA